jgi:hypothetical protein
MGNGQSLKTKTEQKSKLGLFFSTQALFSRKKRLGQFFFLI